MAPFNLFKWVSNPTRHLKSVLVALHFAGLMCFPRTKGRHESSLLTLCRFPSVTWWIFDAVASQHACISETSAQERLHSSQQWDQSKLKRVDSLTTSKALGFFFSTGNFVGWIIGPAVYTVRTITSTVRRSLPSPVAAPSSFCVHSPGANAAWHLHPPPPSPHLSLG